VSQERGAGGLGAPRSTAAEGWAAPGGLGCEPWRWQRGGTAGTALRGAPPWLAIDFPILKHRNEPVASWKRLKADDWKQAQDKLGASCRCCMGGEGGAGFTPLLRSDRGQNEEQLSAAASLCASALLASEGCRLSRVYTMTRNNLGANNGAFELLFPLAEAPSLGLCRDALSSLRLLCPALRGWGLGESLLRCPASPGGFSRSGGEAAAPRHANIAGLGRVGCLLGFFSLRIRQFGDKAAAGCPRRLALPRGVGSGL